MMAVRAFMAACVVSSVAFVGWQAQPTAPATQPVFTSQHDKDMASFFGSKPVKVVFVNGKMLRGCTYMGTPGRDDKDFIKLRDWMGKSYVVRFEHIVAIKK